MMNNPAMSLEPQGEEVFLALEARRIKVPLPYDREVFYQTLRAEGLDSKTIASVEHFLEHIRAHFQRPDILAAA
jgi:hypothetical protein